MNKKPQIKDTAAQDSTDKEPKLGITCSAIGARERIISDFLRRCMLHEADPIRVTVGHAVGKDDAETIEAADPLAVNRFLNHGLAKT